MPDAENLRWSLRSLGLSDNAITAAWPDWWGDAAEASASARAELRFSLSRKLGLDPGSLFDDQEPRFVWHDIAKFKRLTTESANDQAALLSFGASVARALISATPPGCPIVGLTALSIRKSILASQPFVRLTDLLALCWALGIPVVHLRVFPLQAKRMAAMIVRSGERFAVLLGRDSIYPAPIAFYLAHEIGHAALGHVGNDIAVVDFGELMQGASGDTEEEQADAFALEFLTGMSAPSFATNSVQYTAAALANSALRTAAELRIEPGTIALCFGHSTADWKKAKAALKIIYPHGTPVWNEVNGIAFSQLQLDAVNDDVADFVRAIMGGESGD